VHQVGDQTKLCHLLFYYEDKTEELKKELNNYINIMLSCQGLFSLLVIGVLDVC